MRTIQFEAAIKSVLNNAIFDTDIDRLIKKVVNSGAIDIDSIEEGDYLIVKAAAFVILQELAENLRPMSKEGQKEAINISKFI